MDLNTIDLHKVNLDNDNFYKYDPEIIIHARRMTWYNEYK